MYQNQAHRPPTDGEKTILTAYATIGNGHGKTAPQMAAELNDPARIVQNPAPQGRIQLTTMTKDEFSHRTFGAYMAIKALPDSDPHKATYLDGFAYVRDFITDTVDLTSPVLSALFSQAAAQGIITNAAALVTDPDSSYQATTHAGPLAFELLGLEVAVEASDFA